MVSVLQRSPLSFQTFAHTLFLAGTTVTDQTATGFRIVGPTLTWVWGGRGLTFDANGMPSGGTVETFRLYVGDPANGDWILTCDTNFHTLTPAILSEALALRAAGQTAAAAALVNAAWAGEPYGHTLWSGGLLKGTAGDDYLVLSGPAGRAFGYGGEDSINFGAADDVGYGGADRDWLRGAAGHDRLSGDDGNDQLFGDDGNDALFGGAGDDGLQGGNGADRMLGGAGNDDLEGGTGRDLMNGGDGNDRLDGGGGDDVAAGGGGNDTVFGNTGADLLSGDGGQDRLFGGADNDRLSGGNGADLLAGGAGDDLAHGGAGNDTIAGGAGNDLLDGGEDADLLIGADGDDDLLGGGRNDRLAGGNGNDYLAGGDGNDRLTGGEGADTFAFFRADDPAHDEILDHSVGEDIIELVGFGFASAEEAIRFAIAADGNAIINLDHERFIIVRGVDISTLAGLRALTDDITIA